MQPVKRMKDGDVRWTPEMHTLLVVLWNSNMYSGSRIAEKINERFGTTFSRSAVIARANRNSLRAKPNNTIYTNGGSTRNEAARQRHARAHARVAATRKIPDDLLIPIEQRKTFSELQPHQCHWPVGDPRSPDFFYCGADRFEDSSYCAGHYQRSVAS